MQKIIAQFEKHSGPTAMGEHKITFVVQKEFGEALYPVLQKLEKLPQVVMYLDLIESREQANEALTETDEEKWTRQNRKIHALFDDVAAVKKLKSGQVKKTIKEKLIKKGMIKDSLKELTIEQQMAIITDLENLVIKLKYDD
jgi:hypothetical protein